MKRLRDKKLQSDINRETAKVSALSSDKIDKYQHLTDEEILLSDQSGMIEQANFIYLLLGKALEKQTQKKVKIKKKKSKH